MDHFILARILRRTQKKEELLQLLLKTPKTHIHIMKIFLLVRWVKREEQRMLLLKTPKTHIQFLNIFEAFMKGGEKGGDKLLLKNT